MKVIDNLNSPEGLMARNWQVKEGFQPRVDAIKTDIQKLGLFWDGKTYINGGRIAFPEGSPELSAEEVKGGRPFLILPIKEKPEDLDYKFVFQIASQVKEGNEKSFIPNFRGYREFVGKFVAEEWKRLGKKGNPPIPTVEKVFDKESGLEALTKEGPAVLSEFRPKIKNMGYGSEEESVHILNTHQFPNSREGIRRYFDYLEAVHPSTSEFEAWRRKKGYEIPESWDTIGNEKSGLRCDQWWYNPERDVEGAQMPEGGWGDRLEEISKKLDTPALKEIIEVTEKEIRNRGPEFSNFNFKDAIRDMIKNNLPIYRFQNGGLELTLSNGIVLKKDPIKLADSHIALGTAFPNNIHFTLNSGGEMEYTFTSGDRSHLIANIGEEDDMAVVGSITDRDLPQMIIDEFNERHPDMRDKRGHAMQLMYRGSLEAEWTVTHDHRDSAEKLVNMLGDIVTGNGKDWNGAWNGVDKPMTN